MSGLVFVIRRVSRLCILVAVRVWNVTRISSDSEFLARMFNTQWNARRDMQHLQNQNQTRLPQVWIWNELRASRLESYVYLHGVASLFMMSRLVFIPAASWVYVSIACCLNFEWIASWNMLAHDWDLLLAWRRVLRVASGFLSSLMSFICWRMASKSQQGMLIC